jgi:exodeoxyribonuclease-1
MERGTLFWHDYETFGVDPRRDRPAQFAGLRTDYQLNVISDPLVIFCKPALDYLPDPEACLITGITPQMALEKGVCEADFIKEIHQQISIPSTCTVGYNNIRFDDEVTRHTLYRNFYDPYAREWQNGNSRWDLIDLLRITRALRPEGIEWPNNEAGKPSFRLEDLTASNGIEHGSAHDALADVQATIALAKLIQQAQPKLFQYVFENRNKSRILEILKLGSLQPVVHVSGMFPAETGCLAVVVPLCEDPLNKNGVLVYNLAVDPNALLTLDAEYIHQCVFTAADDLPEGLNRIPLKTIHINKCPVVAPLSVLRPVDAERLNINLADCLKNLQAIKAGPDLKNKLHQVFGRREFTELTDPDLMLYSGGFFNTHDKAMMQTIRQTSPNALADLQPDFDDARLPEMLFRYRARNYPDTLTKDETTQWVQFCIARLSDQSQDDGLTFTGLKDLLTQLRQRPDVDLECIMRIEQYSETLKKQLKIT